MNTILRKSALAVVLSAAMATSAFSADRSVEQQVSDARIEAQIATAITFNRHLNPFEISVEVRGNSATLAGSVDEAIDKELAERVAQNAKGVDTVNNMIKVVPNSPRIVRKEGDRDFNQSVEDATLTATVKSRLLWNDITDGLDINVDTNNQRVTLTGTANTEVEKATAARLAINTDGVHHVDNKLVVTPGKSTADNTASAEPVEDGWITAKVKSSLLVSKNVDGLDLTVETKNGTVMLGGHASTTAERDLAAEIARDIRGVKEVTTSGVKVGP